MRQDHEGQDHKEHITLSPIILFTMILSHFFFWGPPIVPNLPPIGQRVANAITADQFFVGRVSSPVQVLSERHGRDWRPVLRKIQLQYCEHCPLRS